MFYFEHLLNTALAAIDGTRVIPTITNMAFAILLIGFLLWISYGIAARNLALIVPNTVALLIGAGTIAVALRLGHGASGGR